MAKPPLLPSPGPDLEFEEVERYMAFHRQVQNVRRMKRDEEPVQTSMGLVSSHYRNRTRSTNRYEYARSVHATLYKTVRGALEQSRNSRGDVGLVVKLRPDDLEPINITSEQRVAWFKEQITKWRERIFGLGLTADELTTLADNEMLAWGEAMKKYQMGNTI